MQQLYFADIFFLVTTISVVLVAAALAAFLIYVALIARDIRKISKKLKQESLSLIDNVVTVKDYFFSERERMMDVAFFVADVVREFRRPAPASSKRASKKKSSSRKTSSKKASSKKSSRITIKTDNS